MAAPARERVTIDLRGLGAAVKAHAQARDLRVSDVIRLALVDALKVAWSDLPFDHEDSPDPAKDRSVKVTVRLRKRAAARLAAGARACGLSQSAYLTTLIRGVPAPPRAVGDALRSSTEQLAVVSTDLSGLTRILRRDAGSSSAFIERSLQPLLDDVQRHVRLASRLMSELGPARGAGGGQRAGTTGRP